MFQKYAKHLPIGLELIPLALLAIGVYIAAINYPLLPDSFPIDFDSRGMVEDWADKGMVFFYPGISAFIYAIFTAVSIAMAAIGDPKRIINMPRQWKDRLTEEQTEGLRPLLIRFLFALKLIIIGMMIFLLSTSVEIALGRATRADSLPILLFTLGIAGTIGILLWKLLRLVHTGDKQSPLS